VTAVNVAEVLDRGRLGRFRAGAFAVLGACLVLDGFDVQAMGYAAPALARAWGLPTAALGPVFGAGLAGLFAGSLVSGMLADRIGRRPVLLGATAVFGLFTLLTAFARSLPELLAVRLAAGLGLGAIMPNATALVGEYAPRTRRVATMMIVTNGFMLGAVLGGLLSAWLVPAHGWRAPFVVGGALPLVLLLPMARWVPESLVLLVVRGAPPAAVARWLRRVDPAAAPPGATFVAPDAPRRPGLSLLRLFGEGRAAATSLLWLAGFANVLVAYLVSSWLPAVLRDAGHATSTAVLVGTAVQLGGLLGTFAVGAAVQRLGFAPVLAAGFTAAAAGLAVVGEPGLPVAALAAVAFVVGWGILAGQPGLNALAATFYPTDLRATGIGAALAVGRLGAVLGPLFAGALLGRGLGGGALFRAAALPALVTTAVVLALREVVAPGAARPPGRCGPVSPAAASGGKERSHGP
jgi:AAHS family 4-hydroxybenzoate transporter-like MFS transporter